MREDEEKFRYYAPLLRRIIILVAVIAAIPVVLWTITTFVHSYVGAPKAPTFRSLAATAPTEAPGSAAARPETVSQPPSAASQTALPDPPPPMVEARATTTDAREYAPAPKGPLLNEHAADSDASVTASMPRVAAVTAAATLATPDDAAPGTGALAAQQPQSPAPPESTADTLPAAAPLTGPIPLPRQRPRYFAVAQAGVPVPRPRPQSASSGTSEAKPGALDWLRNIFQPQQQP
jgi:hypothetical protein